MCFSLCISFLLEIMSRKIQQDFSLQLQRCLFQQLIGTGLEILVPIKPPIDEAQHVPGIVRS